MPGKPIERPFTQAVSILAGSIAYMTLTCTLVFGLLATSAEAQTPAPVLPKMQKVSTPLPHLYWHFFRYQDDLDRLAA
jgi:hypothetical protein